MRKILAEAKGTPYEIPITLACYGMRRSEIFALKPRDIEGDLVHISKALVLDKDKKWVVKTTKTIESTRDIIIPSELSEKIKSQGYVFKGYPEAITKYMSRIEKNLVYHISPCINLGTTLQARCQPWEYPRLIY